jgi:hypothetical protein
VSIRPPDLDLCNLHGTGLAFNGTELTSVFINIPLDDCPAKNYSSSHKPTSTETQTMIPKACRELLDLCLDVANKTENEQLAQVHIERATGMVNCLLTCELITVLEHASEMAWVDLARAVRRAPPKY